MAVFVEIFGAFGLIIFEDKTETMCMRNPRTLAMHIVFNATGQQYVQNTQFTCFVCAVTETPKHVSTEIDRRIPTERMSSRRYTREWYDHPKTSLLRLKARMVKSKAVEALLYGCAIWTPLKGHCNKLRTKHHRMLPRIPEAWRRSSNNRILSYKDALQQTGCESIEATERTRKLIWVRVLLRRGDRRLP